MEWKSPETHWERPKCSGASIAARCNRLLLDLSEHEPHLVSVPALVGPEALGARAMAFYPVALPQELLGVPQEVLKVWRPVSMSCAVCFNC